MNISNDELNSIFRTISAVLQMGNMQFKQERNSDQATLPDNTVAQKVCHLLGIPVTDFVRSFLKPKLKVGRDFVTKAQTQAQVRINSFSLFKESLLFFFRWILLLKQFLKLFMNVCLNGLLHESINLLIEVNDKVHHLLEFLILRVLKSFNYEFLRTIMY